MYNVCVGTYEHVDIQIRRCRDHVASILKLLLSVRYNNTKRNSLVMEEVGSKLFFW